ncbi:hypothetical protein BRC65_03570 [Halobacteriales archaeon QH_2_65_14]|nr:MAG: hypothetical protein BRC65_03570 [Halobacteriales archaeon QH_2_65_14]
MKEYPPVPRVADAPDDLFEEGHLWLVEYLDGAHLRFRLREEGFVQFGDRTQVYRDPDTMPAQYQHAVRHVQEHLDREALRRAVDDVEEVVFFGEAMHYHTTEYDWERTPSFLGFDVWSAEAGAFRPLDTIADIFEHLGFDPVNVFERELRARDFDPDSYTILDSEWYDGPAAGVVVRNKRGDRAKLLHPDVREAGDPQPVEATPAQLAAEFATEGRFETVASTLEAHDRPVTFETLYERTLEHIVRERHGQLHGDEEVDMKAFRSEVAALAREFLRER